MNKDFLAVQSKKNASDAKPFDSIMFLEQTEATRVERELDSMEREKTDILLSARTLEEQAELNARDEAKAELRQFREKWMQEYMQKQLKSGETACEELERKFKKSAPKLVAELVEGASGSNSSLLP